MWCAGWQLYGPVWCAGGSYPVLRVVQAGNYLVPYCVQAASHLVQPQKVARTVYQPPRGEYQL